MASLARKPDSSNRASAVSGSTAAARSSAGCSSARPRERANQPALQGAAGEQVDEGEQAKAEREPVARAHADGVLHRPGPAAGVAIGERQIGDGAVLGAETEQAAGAPERRPRGVAGGIPGGGDVAPAHRRQRLGRQVDEVGQGAVGAGADLHQRAIGCIAAKMDPPSALAPACPSRNRAARRREGRPPANRRVTMADPADLTATEAARRIRGGVSLRRR